MADAVRDAGVASWGPPARAIGHLASEARRQLAERQSEHDRAAAAEAEVERLRALLRDARDEIVGDRIKGTWDDLVARLDAEVGPQP